MNCLKHDILKSLISDRKYSVITEYTKITYPEEIDQIIVSEYTGTDVRVYRDDKIINILCPENMSVIQENSVVKAIENGTIFDDTDTVENGAKYVELTTLPNNAIVNKGKEPQKKLHIILSLVVGKMDENGRCGQCEDDLEDGKEFCKDIICGKSKNISIKDIVDDYIGNDRHDPLNVSLRDDIALIEDELKALEDIEPEDSITDEDWEYLDMMNGDNHENDDIDNNDKPYEEGFISKRPKKLKPIPRDIIPYITIEMNAIQDTNDQAMLSGYTCSKLELVDFYLNVIDTNDDRYIVPHNRTYLVQMQNDLNRLLTQILKIKPVNRNDRVWQVNVNYPDNWRG